MLELRKAELQCYLTFPSLGSLSSEKNIVQLLPFPHEEITGYLHIPKRTIRYLCKKPLL